MAKKGSVKVLLNKPFNLWRDFCSRSVVNSDLRDKPATFPAKVVGILGYLPFTWENRKFQLENQTVRAIPVGKLQTYGL